MAQASLSRRSHLLWIGAQNRQVGSLLHTVNFQLWMIGGTAQAIGQIFYTLALPWLVMKITGSTAAMGIAIAVSGLPRIAFMMVGGALTDRYSPRRLMVIANLVRAALLALLTWVVLTDRVTLAMVFALNFLIGCTDAVLIPAGGALTPRLVREDELKTANSLLAALGNFWGLIGPASAGVLLTQISHSGKLASLVTGDMLAAGAAFALNTLALVLTAVTLLSVKLPADGAHNAGMRVPSANQGSIKELLMFIWRDAALRAAFGLLYLVNIISNGPLFVGMPMLAVSRFPEGAQAIGLLTSAVACGSLLGSLLAGMISQEQSQQTGKTGRVALGGMLGGVALLYGSYRIETALIAVLAIAAIVSYVNVVATTRIQRSTPPAYMGRMVGMLNLK